MLKCFSTNIVLLQICVTLQNTFVGVLFTLKVSVVLLRYFQEIYATLFYLYLAITLKLCNYTTIRIHVIDTGLKNAYLLTPTSSEGWLDISGKFEELWNFPHIIVCFDGKHIAIECPKLTRTLYCNYRGSIVLSSLPHTTRNIVSLFLI